MIVRFAILLGVLCLTGIDIEQSWRPTLAHPNQPGFVLYAFEHLEIHDRVKIEAQPDSNCSDCNTIGCGSSDEQCASIGRHVKVGNVSGRGDISIASSTTVYGDLITNGTATFGKRTRVRGKTVQHHKGQVGQFQISDIPQKHIYAAGRKPDFTVLKGQSKTVAPGKYNRVTAESLGKLALTSGVYFINELILKKGATLYTVGTTGPITVYVKSNILFEASIESRGIDASGFLVVYLGKAPVNLSSGFNGTFVAFKARLSLASSKELYEGAFAANKLIVKQGVRIQHAPFGKLRPQENTGTGFFVADGQVYDANGFPFFMCGVNNDHADHDNWNVNYAMSGIPAIRQEGFNAVRIIWRKEWYLSKTDDGLSLKNRYVRPSSRYSRDDPDRPDNVPAVLQPAAARLKIGHLITVIESYLAHKIVPIITLYDATCVSESNRQALSRGSSRARAWLLELADWYANFPVSDEEAQRVKNAMGPRWREVGFEARTPKTVGDILKVYEKWLIINIANEWSGVGYDCWRKSKCTVWEILSGYVDPLKEAIQLLRNGGLKHMIVIDMGWCGQDKKIIDLFGEKFLNADPERNVVFSWHWYKPIKNIKRWMSDPGGKLRDKGLAYNIGEIAGARGYPTKGDQVEQIMLDRSEGELFPGFHGYFLWVWNGGTYDEIVRDGLCGRPKDVDPSIYRSFQNWVEVTDTLGNEHTWFDGSTIPRLEEACPDCPASSCVEIKPRQWPGASNKKLCKKWKFNRNGPAGVYARRAINELIKPYARTCTVFLD